MILVTLAFRLPRQRQQPQLTRVGLQQLVGRGHQQLVDRDQQQPVNRDQLQPGNRGQQHLKIFKIINHQ